MKLRLKDGRILNLTFGSFFKAWIAAYCMFILIVVLIAVVFTIIGALAGI